MPTEVGQSAGNVGGLADFAKAEEQIEIEGPTEFCAEAPDCLEGVAAVKGSRLWDELWAESKKWDCPLTRLLIPDRFAVWIDVFATTEDENWRIKLFRAR